MESSDALKKRTREIIARLKKEFPEVRTALNHSSPPELLVATILSAQCTDERVNKVTADLFRKYRSAADYAECDIAELERDVKSTGFFRNKAKSIRNCCGMLVEKHGGEVPGTMEELTALPGVWRKTANVVLGVSFGVPGIVVDTHVKRLAGRLGLSAEGDPDRIEADLMETAPKKDWTRLSFLLIEHGRKTCNARKPLCGSCAITDVCPYPEKTPAA